MSRYIDADKLVAHLEDEIVGCKPPFGSRANGKSIAYGTTLGLRSAIAFANTLPTADVVEVVRCKDCVACPQNYLEPFACARNNILVYGNSFCSYGIRREERSENGK